MSGIVIYADGSCIRNPGPGGFGAIISYDGKTEILQGGRDDTTNNQMELFAVIQAFIYLKKHNLEGDIIVRLDSQYVLHGIEKYIHTWVKNGWRLSTGKPVKNKELREKLYDLTRDFSISWERVKGHHTDEYNNQVDEIARRNAMGRVF